MAIIGGKRGARGILLQTGFVCLLALAIVAFLFKIQQNLEAQHVTSGFSFLSRATGWDIGYSILPYNIREPYWWTLLAGLVNTIAVGFVGLVFATMIGLGIAAMRVYGNPVLAGLAKACVEIVRNIPPLLQLFAWYALFTSLPPPRAALQPVTSVFLSARGIFLPSLNVHWASSLAIGCSVAALGFFVLWLIFSFRLAFTPIFVKTRYAGIATGLVVSTILAATILGATPGASGLLDYPKLTGLNIRGGTQLPPELAAIVLATICYGSAYAAEVIRSGFLSVDPGKVEAGKALGLDSWSIFVRIQLPLVVAAIMPMMTNLYVWLMKATTLGIAIGFADLFMVSVSAINQSGQTIEILLIVAIAFWLLNSMIVFLMSKASMRLKYWT